MESTGVPNRIHVSEATANALLASGKSAWLTDREDKVFAKGKGELTTYFAEHISKGASSEIESNSKASITTDLALDMDISI